MKDPEFREEYARADEEFALIETLIRARTAAKLTQEELASRLGTTQSAGMQGRSNAVTTFATGCYPHSARTSERTDLPSKKRTKTSSRRASSSPNARKRATRMSPLLSPVAEIGRGVACSRRRGLDRRGRPQGAPLREFERGRYRISNIG